jgi:signal transduction histidine kinase/CheY-like chemotaxis protein/HPt (histidine-containing phosphotransfer) domain-containing protein
MNTASTAGGEEVPAFPIKSVVLGIAAMVLIAIGSAAITWIVSERIRTITQSQIAVLMASERLQHQSELLELSAHLAIETGDETYARRYGAIQPELRRTLGELQRAIQLPENRATFATVNAAEHEISAIEFNALDLAVSDRRELAREVLEGQRYQALVRTYRSGLLGIERRARGYVDATRREADRYLMVSMAISLVALLLIGLAWMILVRPARRWAMQLADARLRAESATQAKTDFLAVMSHEIRTPLNSVIGFADLLLGDATVRGEQRRQVELIQGAGTMLLTVVNDLLDFSKVEAGRIELAPEPFALESLIDNSVSIVRGSAEAKGLEMRVEIDPCLSPFYLADEARLRQVLLNLLNNAVKFTSHGLVCLAVAKVRDEGDREQVRFTVTDTGLGIQPDQQRLLFKPFSQADASITRRYGGTGLGLSISKRLVELMGGEIGFHSQPGGGSSFWFSLSLPRADAPALPAGAPKDRAGQPRACILVAEDLPMNQELAKAMVARAGHEVDIAADGHEALRAVQEKNYDLVLMDIQMPGMDGITATREIRRLAGPTGQIPIVAMTANVLPQQVAEFLAAGMNGHVAKPVRQRDLETAIASALAGRTLASAEAPPPREPEFDAATFAEVREMLPPERLAHHVASLQGSLETLTAEGGAAPDRETLQAGAHKIVSQAGMLGLVRLSARAREVEEAAREGGPDEAVLSRFREAAGDLSRHVAPLLAA